ncbi:FAD/NAD(P)-binding domain-containing protein, partial [Aureobasidium melanogenum]
MTRKRSWKDADGNIVSKKPQLDGNNEPETMAINDTAPLLSPPLSFGTADNQGPDATNGNPLDRSPPLIQNQPVLTELDTAALTQNGLSTDMPDFTVHDDLFEDAFNPDTASSFNMPYTTMSNYNWLFDLDTQLNHDFTLENMNCGTFPPMQTETSSNDIMHFDLLDLPPETRTVCIHDVLRPQIFAHASFSAVPELWIDCQTAKPETSMEVSGDLEDEWKAWADAEQKKRLALLCFMWDTQHAVLFCQSLCMSSFELRCTLPCDQSLWEAESAETWQKLRKTQTPPVLFLTALKIHIGTQAPMIMPKLNALSRVLILHGLMSIAWDMNRRDQTSLGVVGNDMLDGWKHRIASTYDSWKADFDTYVMSVTQILSRSSASMTPAEQHEARRGFAMFSTANSALYHAAYVVLFSEFLDIQIYAGARHLLGRPVRREDYTRSQQVVKRWANEQTQYAAKAAWHAGHIIKDAVMNLDDFDAGGLFIHPWCLYLATVTVWSYHHARPGGKQSRGSDDDEDEMIWDAQGDMNALIGGMTSGTAEQLAASQASNRKASTAGLTAVISKQLGKVRWAVIVIVGAGLGGLGAAISLLLAGHKVHVLESASKIAEVGAGIQVLPNSSRVLIQWGLEERLLRHATFPDECLMLGWKGERLSSMDFEDATKEYGTPFWDFHRADLHKTLLDRALELGASFSINARVVDIKYEEDGKDTATVNLKSGEQLTADLVVGADGIFSTCRELLLDTPSPPTPTGDLAYRVLLDTKAMKEDPELDPLLDKPHKVRYWMGPGAHAVNYVLRDGELFNMVLLVPDDMPADATTLDGNVEEMIELYKDWDPRIPKLLALCQSVQKWKLCFRAGLESSWSNEDATFVLLGDCVHATLPYLASGAGMSLEDGATLGLCLGKIKNKSHQEKQKALGVYEDCRRVRTESIVARGNLQQELYHFYDGPEQEARDARFQAFEELETEIRLTGNLDADLPAGWKLGDDPLAWRRYGVGSWLMSFDCQRDVEERWPAEKETATTASDIRAQL